MGLYGHRLLEAGASGEPLIYSLTLYERGDGVNHLRVQADNLDQPFDINQGASLTSARPRSCAPDHLSRDRRRAARRLAERAGRAQGRAADAADPLTAWAAGHLASSADRSLPAMLEAAMASHRPAHGNAFTGGGQHSLPTSIPSTTAAAQRRRGVPPFGQPRVRALMRTSSGTTPPFTCRSRTTCSTTRSTRPAQLSGALRRPRRPRVPQPILR